MAAEPDVYAGMSTFILKGQAGSLNHLFYGPVDTAVAMLYRNGFYRSCREVLASSYPVVAATLGEDEFGQLARAYALQNPPTHGTLTGYGQSFASWLGTRLDVKKLFCKELAQLDWAWLQCLHGRDACPSTATDIQNSLAAGDEMDVGLLANAQLLKLNHSVFQYWLSIKNDVEVSSSLDFKTEDQFVLFWRPQMAVMARELTPTEYLVLSSLPENKESGNKLSDSELSEKQLKHENTIETAEIEMLFAQWLENGVLQQTRLTAHRKSQ